MKVIIAGSRSIVCVNKVRKAINDCPFEITEVVCGGARGVDSIGEYLARLLEIPVHRFPADWEKYGRSAGYIRNNEMANNAEALLLVWDGKSSGSAHMKDIAIKKGLPIFEVVVDGS